MTASTQSGGLPRAFVARIAPRGIKRDKPRGTLLDPSTAFAAADTTSEYADYYNATIAKGILPDKLLLEVGQPPTAEGKLLVQNGDLLILLVGSDDPDGSENLRGVIGLAEVENIAVFGTGNSGRLKILAKRLVQIDSLLENADMLASSFREDSGVDDLPIFGLHGAPQAHNLVRFYDKNSEENDPAARDKRLVGFLGMLNEHDPTVKSKLVATAPALAAAIPGSSSKPKPSSAADVSWLLVSSLATKPFAILTGPSGTGKSRMAIELAQTFDYGPGLPPKLAASQVTPATCLAFVPVGADWTDQRSLLGFRNPFGPKRTLEGIETNLTYEVNDTVRLLLRALHPDYRDAPHFLVLDEMNLSHVERYFSSFLSVLEADRSTSRGAAFELIGRQDLQLISEILDEEDGSPMELESAKSLLASGRGVSFPSNLFVIGTVNVDETTYMFSPKVLDRAFVIELKGIDPVAYMEDQLRSERRMKTAVADTLLRTSSARRLARQWESLAPSALFAWTAGELGIPASDLDVVKDVIRRTLSGVDKLLSPVGFGLGYRPVNELIRYLLVHIEASIRETSNSAIPSDWREALDVAVLTKILPKLHGNRRQLVGSLSALQRFFENAPPPAPSYQLGADSITIADSDKLGFALNGSALKLADMSRMLAATGFTTFI